MHVVHEVHRALEAGRAGKVRAHGEIARQLDQDRRVSGLANDADGLAESDPYECYALLERIKKEFSGAEQSAAAEKKLAELKENKSFMAQYEAGKLLADIMKTGAELKGIGSKPVDLSDKACLKANRSAATRIAGAIAALKKKHADTKYCAEALEYARRTGLLTS